VARLHAEMALGALAIDALRIGGKATVVFEETENGPPLPVFKPL
jgi:hypothetical protein